VPIPPRARRGPVRVDVPLLDPVPAVARKLAARQELILDALRALCRV